MTRVKLSYPTRSTASQKFLRTTVDTVLWVTTYLTYATLGSPAYKSDYLAQLKASDLLEHVNYDTMKRAIVQARRYGWIRKPGQGKHVPPEITSAGLKRLRDSIPAYDPIRVWDGKIYLVTYDIPEQARRSRNLLRRHLQVLGCALLQQSVWVTPYNPHDILHSFVKEHRIAGTIIVSDIGANGYIGDEDILSMLVRLYRLIDLNERYVDFISRARQSPNSLWTTTAFLTILADDPQLPFTLLPAWWRGAEAYAIVKPHLDFIHF